MSDALRCFVLNLSDNYDSEDLSGDDYWTIMAIIKQFFSQTLPIKTMLQLQNQLIYQDSNRACLTLFFFLQEKSFFLKLDNDEEQYFFDCLEKNEPWMYLGNLKTPFIRYLQLYKLYYYEHFLHIGSDILDLIIYKSFEGSYIGLDIDKIFEVLKPLQKYVLLFLRYIKKLWTCENIQKVLNKFVFVDDWFGFFLLIYENKSLLKFADYIFDFLSKNFSKNEFYLTCLNIVIKEIGYCYLPILEKAFLNGNLETRYLFLRLIPDYFYSYDIVMEMLSQKTIWPIDLEWLQVEQLIRLLLFLDIRNVSKLGFNINRWKSQKHKLLKNKIIYVKLYIVCRIKNMIQIVFGTLIPSDKFAKIRPSELMEHEELRDLKELFDQYI